MPLQHQRESIEAVFRNICHRYEDGRDLNVHTSWGYLVNPYAGKAVTGSRRQA
jgi:hypothetical protein